jgi:hypothetical protein
VGETACLVNDSSAAKGKFPFLIALGRDDASHGVFRDQERTSTKAGLLELL